MLLFTRNVELDGSKTAFGKDIVRKNTGMVVFVLRISHYMGLYSSPFYSERLVCYIRDAVVKEKGDLRRTQESNPESSDYASDVLTLHQTTANPLLTNTTYNYTHAHIHIEK